MIFGLGTSLLAIKRHQNEKKWNLCYKHKRKSGLCCSFIIGTFLILALGLVWFYHENHASSHEPHALAIGKIYFRHSIALMLLPYFLSIPFYLLICVSFKWACSFWLPPVCNFIRIVSGEFEYVSQIIPLFKCVNFEKHFQICIYLFQSRMLRGASFICDQCIPKVVYNLFNSGKDSNLNVISMPKCCPTSESFGPVSVCFFVHLHI